MIVTLAIADEFVEAGASPPVNRTLPRKLLRRPSTDARFRSESLVSARCLRTSSRTSSKSGGLLEADRPVDDVAISPTVNRNEKKRVRTVLMSNGVATTGNH